MKKLTSILITLLLTACGTFGNKQNVIVTKSEYIGIPAALLNKCEVPAPFSKNSYLYGDSSVKEELLANLIIKQYKSLEKCNNQMSAIKDWNDKQKAIFKKE